MDKPLSNIFESTLLGTGGGYGESTVIHLGNDHWIVVDSCIDPETKESLPLKYLNDINVDLKNQVKLIVCTHWHDDHINGLSELLSNCENAVFSIAKTTDVKKFLRLIGLDSRKSKYKTSLSSTTEFSKCLEILEKRNGSIKQAIEDRTLLSGKIDDISYEIFALSPSDYVVEQFDLEISTLITEFGKTNKKIIIEKPNSKSVALFIKVNEIRILLGSDLEVDQNKKKGWLRVLNDSQVIDNKSSLYKVPHHGSENGHHDRIWKELLIPKPITKLTPWNKKETLPQLHMIEKIRDNSEVALITSTATFNKLKPKQRQGNLTKTIRLLKPSLSEVKYTFGKIKCRANIRSVNPIWSIEVDGSANIIV